MTAMVGYGRQGTANPSRLVTVPNPFLIAVFDYRSQYWIWSPILGSICGGLSAAFIYDVLIYRGSDSFINSP
jgi:aquaglyceroporin related protein